MVMNDAGITHKNGRATK